MKKLNHFLMAGLALVAAVSCNKTETPAAQPEENLGVPMTLTATICGPETKLTMAEDGNVLKATIVVASKYRPQLANDLSRKALIKDIQTFVKNITAPYMYPRVIEFADALPKTISGKIRHVEIREHDSKK